MRTDLLTIINTLGAAVAMINQLANGEATFNQGRFPVDNADAVATLSRLALDNLDELITKLSVDPGR